MLQRRNKNNGFAVQLQTKVVFDIQWAAKVLQAANLVQFPFA
jgi:hypothetical protein